MLAALSSSISDRLLLASLATPDVLYCIVRFNPMNLSTSFVGGGEAGVDFQCEWCWCGRSDGHIYAFSNSVDCVPSNMAYKGTCRYQS